jgi:hypothetical protein
MEKQEVKISLSTLDYWVLVIIAVVLFHMLGHTGRIAAALERAYPPVEEVEKPKEQDSLTI